MNLRILRMVSGLTVAVAMQFGLGERAFAATTNVSFGNFSFSPKSVTIKVGDTVLWTNTGGSHTVTGDGSDTFCGSGTIPTSCSHTFNTTGTFPYHCIPHQSFGMVGTVIVQAVSGTPPSVTITNPVNGAVFAAPANVTIQANASDTDGNVTTVQFFTNSVSAGADTTAPYSVVASNLAAGSYALRAVAADDSGLTSTSLVVNISVVAPAAVTLSSPVVSNGQFQFMYSADAGLRYVVENSSNLVNWSSLTTNTASGSTVLYGEVFDVNVLRFYRVGRLPNP